ncbi:MAG: DNA adenine methylase [bacterium]|nr:DNA adenine methylase [bacterium]
MSYRETRSTVPRPFLKWAGGKRQLLRELMPRVEKAAPFGRYHEPFVGGGALFFAMYRNGMLGRKQAYLSDSNDRLIDTYRVVRDSAEDLIERLEEHKVRHCEEYYYKVREDVPTDLIDGAARIVYLNRTCYNGLFRENSKGLFNVPFGRYKNPLICDVGNLRAASEALGKTKLRTRSFECVLKAAEPGDLVYFDPPYHPVSQTASFTAYHNGGFGEDSQRALARVFTELSERGVKVLLSNSFTPLVRDLYGKGAFTLDEVLATRLVNSRADRRGKTSEALVNNFDAVG